MLTAFDGRSGGLKSRKSLHELLDIAVRSLEVLRVGKAWINVLKILWRSREGSRVVDLEIDRHLAALRPDDYHVDLFLAHLLREAAKIARGRAGDGRRPPGLRSGQQRIGRKEGGEASLQRRADAQLSQPGRCLRPGRIEAREDHGIQRGLAGRVQVAGAGREGLANESHHLLLAESLGQQLIESRRWRGLSLPRLAAAHSHSAQQRQYGQQPPASMMKLGMHSTLLLLRTMDHPDALVVATVIRDYSQRVGLGKSSRRRSGHGRLSFRFRALDSGECHGSSPAATATGTPAKEDGGDRKARQGAGAGATAQKLLDEALGLVFELLLYRLPDIAQARPNMR